MPKKEKTNALSILKSDHQKVKDLFDEFESAKSPEKKDDLIGEAVTELKIHSTIEEEIFYPAVREKLDEDEEIMDEAAEEHHVAKVLIAELENLDSSDGQREAKFTVLAENVRHHIKEEEGEMFPKIKKSDLDLDELGQMMMQRKQELQSEGVPATSEEEMVKQGAEHDQESGTQKEKELSHAK